MKKRKAWFSRLFWFLLAAAMLTIMYIAFGRFCYAIDSNRLNFPVIIPALKCIQFLLVPAGIIKTALLFYRSRGNIQDNWFQYIIPLRNDKASLIIYIGFYTKVIFSGVIIIICSLNRSIGNFYMLLFCVAYIIKSAIDLMALISIFVQKNSE